MFRILGLMMICQRRLEVDLRICKLLLQLQQYMTDNSDFLNFIKIIEIFNKFINYNK